MSDRQAGWMTVPLGDVADVELGKMLDKKRTEGSKLPYLRNVNVRWGKIDVSDLLEMPFRDRELDRYALHPGDVMVCEGGEPGRAAAWTGVVPGIKYQKALHRVRLRGGLLPNWLVYQLYLDASSGRLARQLTGTTIGHLPREAFVEYGLRLAPLPEQSRIIEAIESDFSRLDDAMATLERVQRNLKRYRASVLKAAVDGRLVPTEAELARAEGRDYEPASVLLKRILTERRRRWHDTRGRGKYEEPVPPDVLGLTGLPVGWCWATIDMLADVGTGATPKRGDPRYWSNGTIPWVTSAVVGNEIVTKPSAFVSVTALRDTNLTLYPPGTLLVAMYGEGKTRGKCSELAIESTTNQALAALVTTETEVVIRPWLKLFLAHNYDRVRRQASGGVQPNLNLSIIRQIVLPFPPLAEQARISSEVETTLSIISKLSIEIGAYLEKGSRLRQSILRWAFEGRLVDQDPRDEPASVLLERIQKETAARADDRPSKRRGQGRTMTGTKRVKRR